jgi:NDP-sugar pyrophosphorylase family protein
MLLCAGLSSRLGRIGDELPKPLLPVCDIPIVRYGIALLVGHGIRDIVINLHHRGDLIRADLGDGSALGARIHYSEEDIPLETGGGLKKALPLLDPDGRDEPFVSMNGKLIFDLDIAALLEAVARDPEVLGTLVVRRVPNATSWGAVQVEPKDDRETGGVRARVRDILGQGQHMFTGVHVTRPSVVRRLPDGKACMIRQGYLPWLHAGGEVAAFDAGSVYFSEHSLPERYLRANLDLLTEGHLRHPPGQLRGVDSSAHVHPTAILRRPFRIGPGAHIGAEAVIGPGAVVGAHTIVEDGAHIERAVVWSHARASGAVHDAVLTWTDRVPVPAQPGEPALDPSRSATPPATESPSSPGPQERHRS